MNKKQISLGGLEKRKRLSPSELKSLKGGSGYSCYCTSDYWNLSWFFLEGYNVCESARSEAESRCNSFGLYSGCNC